MSDWPSVIEERPHAEIQRIGRWTYRVSVVHGISVWGLDGYGWRVLGGKRAERKARRVLARYRRDQLWSQDVREIAEERG